MTYKEYLEERKIYNKLVDMYNEWMSNTKKNYINIANDNNINPHDFDKFIDGYFDDDWDEIQLIDELELIGFFDEMFDKKLFLALTDFVPKNKDYRWLNRLIE